MIQVIGQPLYERWARLMGEEHWLDTEKFGTDEKRGENRDEICERTQAWCSEKSNRECLNMLAEARIPSGPVLSPEDAINDEHVNEMNFLKPLDYPGLKTSAPVSPLPIRYTRETGVDKSEESAAPFVRPPELGEHTDQILTGLGYSLEAVKALREKGVI